VIRWMRPPWDAGREGGVLKQVDDLAGHFTDPREAQAVLLSPNPRMAPSARASIAARRVIAGGRPPEHPGPRMVA
jgi:hypothetical protein